ncbi:MAG: hypothetical protein ACM3X9_07985 [Bacillota bacterium]
MEQLSRPRLFGHGRYGIFGIMIITALDQITISTQFKFEGNLQGTFWLVADSPGIIARRVHSST